MRESGGHRISGGVFAALVTAAVAARLLMVWLLPPLLDVYYYDAQAARAVLSGIDPYGLAYVGIPEWLSTPDAMKVFAYLPGVAIFLAPFEAAWDVRLGLVLADLVVGLGVYSLGGRRSSQAALVFLLLPFTALFSTSYPNNTLVSMVFLALAVPLWVRGRGRVASVMVGVALASSQFVWLLLPLFVAWSVRTRRFDEVAIQLAVALALILPFIAWNPGSFFYDTVVFQFTRTPRTLVSPAAFGFNVNLTLDGIVYTLFGVGVPLVLRALVVVAGAVPAVLKSRDLREVLFNGSLFMVLVVFVLPNVLSFWYLELPFVTILMWLAMPGRDSATMAFNA